MKRATPSQIGATKRFRHAEVTVAGRLCDLDSAEKIFFDEHSAALAKESGIFRARNATDKYRDLERQLLEILQESHGIDAINEKELRDTLPSELEAETADRLVSQVVRHQRYERAARELACESVTAIQEEHERELQQLRLQHEAEVTRIKVSADVRSSADVEVLNDQLRDTREEYEEKAGELEEKVAELEQQLAEAAEKQEETETEARERIAAMEEQMLEMTERVVRAEAETDLKREASKRLKEEVIDNDRLTCANLNRIKTLEAQLQEQFETIEQLEEQNVELRGRDDSSELTSEVANLKEKLEERERQLMTLAHKLEAREVMAEAHNNTGRLEMTQGKRESLLDRISKASSYGASLI